MHFISFSLESKPEKRKCSYISAYIWAALSTTRRIAPCASLSPPVRWPSSLTALGTPTAGISPRISASCTPPPALSLPPTPTPPLAPSPLPAQSLSLSSGAVRCGIVNWGWCIIASSITRVRFCSCYSLVFNVIFQGTCIRGCLCFFYTINDVFD